MMPLFDARRCTAIAAAEDLRRDHRALAEADGANTRDDPIHLNHTVSSF
jgi:hypothetical protein